MAVDVKTFTDAAQRVHDQTVLEVRALVAEMIESGQTDRAKLLDELERVRGTLRENGAPAEAEDIVLDVMDFLADWSSPHMRIAHPAG